MPPKSTQNSYHPMFLVLYRLGMIAPEMLKQIPSSTIHYWKSIDHTTQFGYDLIEEYYNKHQDIREVYTSKLVFRFTRFACDLVRGYQKAFNVITCPKTVMKKAKSELVRSTDYIGQKVKTTVHARLLGMSLSSFKRIKSEVVCAKSKIGRCYRRYTTQLTFQESQLIANTIEQNQDNLPKSTLYFRLRNEGKLFCSLTTFYNYSAGLAKKILLLKPKREPLIAKKPFEFIHVDITEVPTLDGKFKVAFIKDNFSLAILNWSILPNGKSIQIRKLFESTFEKYNLAQQTQTVTVVSDQGSENKGEMLLWIANQIIPEVKKLTSGIDVKSNSMSESVHHLLKNEFGLKLGIPADSAQLNEKLTEFVHYHNHIRLPILHDGYTCDQILNGTVIDKVRFKEENKQARTKRMEMNRSFRCFASSKC